MGALSNSSRKLSNMAGFYKGIQSAAAAIFWRLDGLKTEYTTEFAATVCFPPTDDTFNANDSILVGNLRRCSAHCSPSYHLQNT
jgi:hypothetical protein